MLFFDAVRSGTDLRLMIATNNATALVLLTDNDPEEVFSRVNVVFPIVGRFSLMYLTFCPIPKLNEPGALKTF